MAIEGYFCPMDSIPHKRHFGNALTMLIANAYPYANSQCKRATLTRLDNFVPYALIVMCV
eukprot:1160513-Pelagomonas_calceolata.AAC.22